MSSLTPRWITALLLAAAAYAQTPVSVTGLCNTGRTKSSPLPRGCITTTLVTPVNPESGGDSVDGNWQLATPYPSAAYNAPVPNACLLSSFGPAWVDQPWPGWFNPDDGSSQYIAPLVEGPVAAGGWFVYRTAFPIPPVQSGFTYYLLTVSGQALVDNNLVAIVLEDPAGYVPSCRPVSQPGIAGFSSWSDFAFQAAVFPKTLALLYFITYNGEQSYGNPTGLRVEFTSASLTPQ